MLARSCKPDPQLDSTQHSRRLQQGSVFLCSYGEDHAFLVGQLGYKGAVAAADDWGSPLKFKIVTPAVQGEVVSLLDGSLKARYRSGDTALRYNPSVYLHVLVSVTALSMKPRKIIHGRHRTVENME
jgi:erythromycin esterase-like protein